MLKSLTTADIPRITKYVLSRGENEEVRVLRFEGIVLPAGARSLDETTRLATEPFITAQMIELARLNETWRRRLATGDLPDMIHWWSASPPPEFKRDLSDPEWGDFVEIRNQEHYGRQRPAASILVLHSKKGRPAHLHGMDLLVDRETTNIISVWGNWKANEATTARVSHHFGWRLWTGLHAGAVYDRLIVRNPGLATFYVDGLRRRAAEFHVRLENANFESLRGRDLALAYDRLVVPYLRAERDIPVARPIWDTITDGAGQTIQIRGEAFRAAMEGIGYRLAVGAGRTSGGERPVILVGCEARAGGRCTTFALAKVFRVIRQSQTGRSPTKGEVGAWVAERVDSLYLPSAKSKRPALKTVGKSAATRVTSVSISAVPQSGNPEFVASRSGLDVATQAAACLVTRPPGQPAIVQEERLFVPGDVGSVAHLGARRGGNGPRRDLVFTRPPSAPLPLAERALVPFHDPVPPRQSLPAWWGDAVRLAPGAPPTERAAACALLASRCVRQLRASLLANLAGLRDDLLPHEHAALASGLKAICEAMVINRKACGHQARVERRLEVRTAFHWLQNTSRDVAFAAEKLAETAPTIRQAVYRRHMESGSGSMAASVLEAGPRYHYLIRQDPVAGAAARTLDRALSALNNASDRLAKAAAADRSLTPGRRADIARLRQTLRKTTAWIPPSPNSDTPYFQVVDALDGLRFMRMADRRRPRRTRDESIHEASRRGLEWLSAAMEMRRPGPFRAGRLGNER